MVHHAIADRKNQTPRVVGSSAVERSGVSEVLGGFEGIIRGFQGALEVGDGHSDFCLVLSTQSGGELGSADRGSGGKADGFRVLPQVLTRIEKSIDPFVEAKRVGIDGRLREFLELVVTFLLFVLEINRRLACNYFLLFLLFNTPSQRKWKRRF